MTCVVASAVLHFLDGSTESYILLENGPTRSLVAGVFVLQAADEAMTGVYKPLLDVVAPETH